MEKLKEVLSQVLKVEKGKITDKLSPADAANWDSMSAIVLILAVESAFDVKFTTAEIKEIRCVGDIRKILKEKGIRA
jgi:acyl carrier protein